MFYAKLAGTFQKKSPSCARRRLVAQWSGDTQGEEYVDYRRMLLRGRAL